MGRLMARGEGLQKIFLRLSFLSYSLGLSEPALSCTGTQRSNTGKFLYGIGKKPARIKPGHFSPAKRLHLERCQVISSKTQFNFYGIIFTLQDQTRFFFFQ